MLYESNVVVNGVEVRIDFCCEGWSAVFDNRKGKVVGSYGDLQPYSMEYLTKLVKSLY